MILDWGLESPGSKWGHAVTMAKWPLQETGRAKASEHLGANSNLCLDNQVFLNPMSQIILAGIYESVQFSVVLSTDGWNESLSLEAMLDDDFVSDSYLCNLPPLPT